MIPLFDRRRKGLLAAVLAAALVQLGATIVVARTLHAAGHEAWPLAAVAAVVGFGCEALLRRLSEGLGLDYVTAVRDRLFRHLVEVEPAVIQRRRHGAMLQSFVGDLTALRQWVAEGVMRTILALVALAGLIGWLGLTMPRLAMAALGIALFACLVGGLLLRPLSRAVQTVRRERGRVSAFASERLSASATILASARGPSEAKRLANRVDRLNRAALRRAWLTGLLRALPHLATTAIVIAAVLAAGSLPAGGMAGTVLVIGIIGLALRDLARAAELTVPGLISHRRIELLLALPLLERAEPEPWKRGETRSLVLARLKLERGAKPFSASARQGEVIGIDGDPRQAGALFRVLAGLANPASGAVRWNGSDLLARTPTRRRRIVGLANADLPLLRGSNALNLRYRVPGAPVEEIAALAQAWHIDLKANDGNSAHLVLARALVGQPPLLLLAPDELALGDAGALQLAEALKDWPGVVLLTSRHPVLTRIMTRHWTLGSEGLVEQPATAGPALAPVGRERRA